MDPNENIEEQRRIVADILAWQDGKGPLAWKSSQEIADHVNRLAHLVAALDEWMKRGGALPKSWLACR